MGVGEKLTVQLSDKSQRLLDLTKLGLEGRDLELFQQALRLSSGLILVTGPEGSGKLTTLYAALTSINRPDINIITIEDTVQFDLPGVNQTRIRPDLGLTHSDALRVILRQDPNVICLSELRDTDTTRMAVRAAEAGHLVLSTLHSSDAITAIGRLLELGIEPFLLAESLRMIIAQRLVRKLCPHCKIPVTPLPEQISELGHPTRVNARFFSSKGCPSCHHFGYRGRTGAFEILPITPEFGGLIANGAAVSELKRWFQESGICALRSAALTKAERSETSIDEVLRETPPLNS
jgi:type II secretory ATPase GspE/PulE/Tfp pilus assembly ATPase PilB-like protein